MLLGSLWASALAILCFPWATTPWLLMLAAILFGAAIGYMGPAPAAVIADLTPPGAAGKVMGVYRGVGDTGLLLGPIAVGWAASHLGFTAAFITVATCTALMALIGSGMRETLLAHEGTKPLQKTEGSVI